MHASKQERPLEAVDLRLAGHRVHALRREGPRPALFVHGLAASSVYFADAGARRELGGRGLLALDLPGFGLSPAPPGFGFTMAEQAEVVAAAVEYLGHEVTLVGHSMGGTAAVLAAERVAERLSAIVIAEGVVCEDPSLWSEQIARISATEWEAAFADLRRRPEIFARGGMVRRRKEAVARVAPAVLQTTACAMRASAADLHAVSVDPSTYERFRALRPRPVYVFGDYHDNTAVYARMRGDGVQVEDVRRAGHLMMLDNPDGFYAIVADAGG
jgi:pimeloyl-ACP methyl ester carboxylesterase